MIEISDQSNNPVEMAEPGPTEVRVIRLFSTFDQNQKHMILLEAFKGSITELKILFSSEVE